MVVMFNQIFCEKMWWYLFKAVFSCVGRGFSWKDFTASCKDSLTDFSISIVIIRLHLGEGILFPSGCSWYNHLLLVLLLHLINWLLKNTMSSMFIRLSSHKKQTHWVSGWKRGQAIQSISGYLRRYHLRRKRLKLFSNPVLPVVSNWENLKVVFNWKFHRTETFLAVWSRRSAICETACDLLKSCAL